ncbi:MAG: 50S ribosomal protein L11 methyltransferase [Desulfobacteraceae bacterium]
MKWTRIKAEYESENPELAEDLVSDLFFSNLVKGVVCSMPPSGTGPGQEPGTLHVTGYVPCTREGDAAVRSIISAAGRLESAGIKVDFTCSTIDEEDWSRSWKEHFHVTRITDRMVVKPEWKKYSPGPDEIVVEIDPGMAFGTGTHPTTRLCMKILETSLKKSHTLLDVGTGSGILMITAAKMGASCIYGIDNDPVAVRIARENILKNGPVPGEFHLETCTIEHMPFHTFDIICANILSGVIIKIMPEIKKRLGPEGTAILSGIIREQQEAVLSGMDKNGLYAASIEQEEEWVAIAAAHA